MSKKHHLYNYRTTPSKGPTAFRRKQYTIEFHVVDFCEALLSWPTYEALAIIFTSCRPTRLQCDFNSLRNGPYIAIKFSVCNKKSTKPFLIVSYNYCKSTAS